MASVDGNLGSYHEMASGLTLEEDAARRDAVGLASKPDMTPLTELKPLIGVGMLQPGPGSESNLYMPVERQEQVSAQNLAVTFARLDVSDPAAETTHILTDVVVLESKGEEPVITMALGQKFTLVKVDLLPAVEGLASAEQPHVWLCVKSEKAGECTEPPLVDLALVYGSPSSGPDFEMGGGFESVELPPALTSSYGCRVYLCLKREGAGLMFAEELAARAAAEAAEAMENKSVGGMGGDGAEGSGPGAGGGGGGGGGGLDNPDLDDELLDTSLTPEQIRDLEDRRAKEMRERALRSEAEAEGARQEAFSAEVRRQLSEAYDRRDALVCENDGLQATSANLFHARNEVAAADGTGRPNKVGAGGADGGDADGAEGERQYGDALNSILETEERHKHMATEFERVTRDLQTKLDDKEAKAVDIYETFRAFKTQIALQAQNSRTGKAVPKKDVEAFRGAEKERDDEASRVRLRNVNLRLMLKKLEAGLKAKEQLAEGLHMIDFEQLKIENQTLSERAEERSTELNKLRKKKTDSVEMLSHVKEKLHFTRQSSEASKEKLAELEVEVGQRRDALTKHKRERDRLKKGNAGYNTDAGFTKSTPLVLDFEQRKKSLALLRDKIQETKEKYLNLSAFVEGANAELGGRR